MKPLLYPTDLRQWWWSKQPFWQYTAINMANGGLMGWATMVEKHPGLFNLAWLISGVDKPPADFSQTAHLTQWVYTDGIHIPMAGRTMAEWAFDTSIDDFKFVFESDSRVLKRWDFRESNMTYDMILDRLQQRTARRAKL